MNNYYQVICNQQIALGESIVSLLQKLEQRLDLFFYCLDMFDSCDLGGGGLYYQRI
jgi:hypothetical protein